MQQTHRWAPRLSIPARVTLPQPVDPAGVTGPTRGEARGKGWRRSSYGLFVPSGVDGSAPEQRIAEQAAQCPSGAVTAWAALRLHRGTFFDGVAPDGLTNRPVPVIAPGASRRPRPGVLFSQDRLDESEVTVIAGVRCVRPRRALFDEMRWAPDLREAIVAMDMAAAARIMSIARMRTYVANKAGWQGVEQVRAALELADEDSRSPQEVKARLVWEFDARLPRPLVNQPVFDLHERLLGYADLLDPEAGLVLEYDGADHRSARRHSKDVDREAAFRRCLLEVTRATAADVRVPDRLVRRVLEARSRARFLPPTERPWTLELPPDFPLELPLDVELDLRGESD